MNDYGRVLLAFILSIVEKVGLDVQQMPFFSVILFYSELSDNSFSHKFQHTGGAWSGT